MEEYNYNRKYELIISQPYTRTDFPYEIYTTTPLRNTALVYKTTDDYKTVNAQRNVTLTDLHMTADIATNNKSSGSKGSNATIKIFNLSERDRKIVETVNNYIVLNAGYEDQVQLPLVYSGQVQQAYSRKEGENYITYLICKDGYTPLNAVRISYSLAKAEPPSSFRTYGDVIRGLADIFRENGVTYTEESLVLDKPVGLVYAPTENPDDIILERGYSYTGSLRKAMDDVCNSLSLTWMILANVLYVYPKYYKDMIGVVELNNSQVLSAESTQGDGRTTSNETDNKGVVITTLLDGRITPTKRLRVTEGEFRGTYRITEVKHKLSYEGQEWYTETVCEGV